MNKTVLLAEHNSAIIIEDNRVLDMKRSQMHSPICKQYHRHEN